MKADYITFVRDCDPRILPILERLLRENYLSATALARFNHKIVVVGPRNAHKSVAGADLWITREDFLNGICEGMHR